MIKHPNFKLTNIVALSIKGNAEKSMLENVKQIVNREPLAPIFEQEKDLVWQRRFVFLNFSLQAVFKNCNM